MELNKKLVFDEYGRSTAYFYTEDKDIINEKIKKQWTRLKGHTCEPGVWLRSPDTWLADLTDFNKVFYYGNPIINFAYFDFLHNLQTSGSLDGFIKYVVSRRKVFYAGFEFAISTGISLETEIRLLGSDSRLDTLKRDIFINFLNSQDYYKYFNNAKTFLEKTRDIYQNVLPYEELDYRVKEFYEKLKSFYACLNVNIKYSSLTIPSVSNNLPEHDILLLIPTGCFKYFSTFVNKENIEKVMFWEFHMNSNNNREYKLFEKDMCGKRVLIIDNVYSGKTINRIAELVKIRGGIPIKFGLFPKNEYSLRELDYFVFIDTVFKANDIPKRQNWCLQLYKKALGGNVRK